MPVALLGRVPMPASTRLADKAPDAIAIATADFSDWLPAGGRITRAGISVYRVDGLLWRAADLSATAPAISGAVVSATLSGGLPGTDYRIVVAARVGGGTAQVKTFSIWVTA